MTEQCDVLEIYSKNGHSFQMTLTQSSETLHMQRHKRQTKKVLRYFVDTSNQPYGTVTNLCKGDRSAKEMAKKRVAPLKTITLPKIELMAAVIWARLACRLKKSLWSKNSSHSS